MANHIQNMSPIGWLLSTFLVSYWLAFTFFITNMEAKITLTSHLTIHIIKVLKRSTMCVHDVTG